MSATPPANAAPPEPAETVVTYAEALQLAITLHRKNHLDAAQEVYQQLIAARPNTPDPIHFLGVLLHRRGQVAEGLRLIRRSVELDSSIAAWHNNLGNALLESGHYEAAGDAYLRSVELDPSNVEVANNLACLLRQFGRYAQAEQLLRDAVERSPDFAGAWANLANVLTLAGRLEESYVAVARALELQPRSNSIRRMLGSAYVAAGYLDEARKHFEQWVQEEPDNERARHHLASLTGRDVPERCSDGYVRQIFDSFANSFDHQLAGLGYRGPQRVSECVGRFLGKPAADRRVLDAGCGTGLCKEGLRPFASRLVGVDLSAGMLERARERGGYDLLEHGELTAWMNQTAERFDLVASTDTLCYFGRLEAVLAAARRITAPGGLLVFTVEDVTPFDREADFRLMPHGRYSHGRHYLASAAAASGWRIAAIEPDVLRREAGKDVAAWVVAAHAA